MKIIFFALLSFIFTQSVYSQCINEWTKNIGDNSSDFGHDVTVDRNGYVYTIGVYDNSVTFGSIVLNSINGSQDVFVVKHDSDGNVVWAKSFGGQSDNDLGYSITTDENNDVYIAGSWYDLTSFGSQTFANKNVIAAKLTSDGNVTWVAQAVGDSFQANDIVAKNGEVYMTGSFLSSVTLGTTTLTNNGVFDAFISRYDSEGLFVFAKSYGSSNRTFGCGLSIDQSGNVLLVGSFDGNLDLGVQTLISQSNYGDVFLLKLDNTLDEIWVKQGFNSLEGWGANIVTDNANNIYIVGTYSSIANFGNFTLTSVGDKDVFVVKYDSNGAELWAKSAGSPGRDIGEDIKIESNNNLYITGDYGGNMSIESTLLNSYGMNDVFIYELDLSGALIEAWSAGGNNEDNSWAIALDPGKAIYTTGYFTGQATFGLDNISTPSSWQNAFLWKVCQEDVGVDEITNENNFDVYPNPVSGNITVKFNNINSDNISLQIVNSMGQLIQTVDVFNKISLVIDTKNLEPGLYFFEIITNDLKIKSIKVEVFR